MYPKAPPKHDSIPDGEAAPAPLHPPTTRRRAFTLIEMVITVFLIGIVFITTMSLFDRTMLGIACGRAGNNTSQSAS